ncbi:three component ABC system middle component [Mycolicibacterium poriferae]|uniref:three component ABC system middle component n=1 Tax=Mycolicibacterium poriferae TaxID=39694 RepID=UPI0024B92C09|nr:three component ABC system middle component [Mycolicibacterium poriferae]|tara:strand:+ start:2056 stop:2547 length:492 start_codon:yes stop_codon:yes gene_type:complete
MTTWSERSRTQAVMFNPALLATLTANAAIRYRGDGDQAMPWVYAFIIAPLVLHRGTRESLPRNIRANLNTWVADHPVEHAGLARRALSLRDPVQEGLRFGLRAGILAVDRDGGLTGELASGRGHALEKDSEVQHIVARAGFVGRWLAKIEQPATAFVVLGVAP